ncbi:MAG: hypothetical protein WBO10_09400 [Pyrinomonadaceae bacterium]
MENPDRQKRAELRRQRVVITRCSLEDSDVDPNPTFGPEAISLVTQLTREVWSLSGLPWPEYNRAGTPYRFTTLGPE